MLKKNNNKYFPTLRGRVRLLAEQLAFKAREPLRQQSGRWPMFFSSHFLSFVAILMLQVFLIFFSCHHYDISFVSFLISMFIIIVTFFFCKRQQKQVKTEIIQASTIVFVIVIVE